MELDQQPEAENCSRLDYAIHFIFHKQSKELNRPSHKSIFKLNLKYC